MLRILPCTGTCLVPSNAHAQQRLAGRKAIVYYWPGLIYPRGRTEIPSRQSEGAPATSSVIPLVRGLNLNWNYCSDFFIPTAREDLPPPPAPQPAAIVGRGWRPMTPSFTHSKTQLDGRGRHLGVRPPGTPLLPYRGGEAGQGRQTPLRQGHRRGGEIRRAPGPAGNRPGGARWALTCQDTSPVPHPTSH